MGIIGRNTKFRGTWDVCAIVLVLVSCLLVSYQLAFVHRVKLFGSLVLYATDLFFLIDIFLNFRTTYHRGGAEVRERSKISRRYMRSLFWVDLLAALPIDALFLGWRDVAFYGISIVVLLRSLRLLRVIRLFAIFGRWERSVWTNPGSLRVAKLVLVIVLALHVLACGWFLCAYVSGFPEDSWVVTQGLESVSNGSQYLRALYWAVVTTTTVGYGDITPSRNVEYVFAMVAILFGASMYAFVIGNIASLLSSLDSAKTAFWRRVETVTQYLRSRRVPPELNEEVRSYYEYIWMRFRGMSERDLLVDLPSPIRLDIFLQLTRELIDRVPLFRHCPPALRNALLMTMKPQIYVPHSYITREGEIGDGLYFISSGSAEIVAEEGRTTHGTLSAGEHFGDLSMMLGERRTAGVRATSYCDVFVLERGDFDRIKRQYSELRGVLRTISDERSEKASELVLQGVIL